MTPTPEEQVQERKALAVLKAGGRVEISPQGYHTGKTHYYATIGRTPKWHRAYGPTAIQALTTLYDEAAGTFGLEPVQLIPEGMFTRADFRQAEHEVLDMLYPSVVPIGDGSNWDDQCEKRRRFLAHADRLAERLWSVAGENSTPSSSSPSVPEGFVLVELGELEHIANLIEESGDGKQHDPSWIRPRTLSAKEREDRLRQALVQIEVLSSSPKETTVTEEPAQDSGFRDAIGVILKEMELFLERRDFGHKAYDVISRWRELIEVAAGPEQNEPAPAQDASAPGSILYSKDSGTWVRRTRNGNAWSAPEAVSEEECLRAERQFSASCKGNAPDGVQWLMRPTPEQKEGTSL